ncbi:caspase family protein [Embleya sp. NPDC001921]
MSEPRRYLIAAGTGTYAEHEPLPGAHPDVARIADLFAGMGYERVLTGVSLDPDAGDFEDALADWCAGDTLTASDIVVVYYAGHGDRPDAGPYRLACAGSKAARPRTWLSLENLASVLAASPARNVLFIVDACYAGAGSPELAAVTAAFVAARARTDAPGSGTWVLASARSRDLAGDMGHFATELGRAHAAGDGASQRHLSPALLADRVNRAFVAAGYRQLAVCSVTDQSIQPPFFPNPAFDPSAEIGPDGLVDGESTDVAAHFEPRGRGVEHVHDPGSYFTGRTRALDVVRARLGGPGGRGPLAVTGAPGSGKSAVLGRIVLEGGIAGGAHRVDVSINARHQTIDALVTRLAAAADVRVSNVDALLTALAARVAPFCVVLDSLDEAGPGHDPNEARRIAWELLRPLGDVPCVRLVVGSRREHLRDWCERAPMVDLDTAEYADDTSVAEYVERILTDGRSPYAEGDSATAATIARAVARRAGRCFLVARMTASALLRDDPVDVRVPGWADALPSDVGGAFRAYLHRLPRERRSTALILLTALAFAEGHGLPREGVWAAVASRLSGESVVERDIDDLVDEEGSYLTTVAVGERRYFRLYHQELADHLRKRVLASRDLTDVQACFAAALWSLVPAGADDRPDWARAHAYIRYHLATHSAAAGTVGELITDPAFVLAAGAVDLLRAVRRARGDSMLPLVVERCAEVLRDRSVDRAAHLAFVARANGEHEFAARALELSASTERVWTEPRLVTPHRIIGHHGAGGFSVRAISPNWWIEELKPAGRSMILALPPDGTCVHVWVPDEPSATKTLPHPDPLTSAAAFVDANDRPVAATLDVPGCLRIWDVHDAVPVLRVPDTAYRRILDTGVLADGTSVVVCAGQGRVDVLEASTGRLLHRVDSVWSNAEPTPTGGLIHRPGRGASLLLSDEFENSVTLHDIEANPPRPPEVLLDDLGTEFTVAITRNPKGDTFIAVLEKSGPAVTRVTLADIGRGSSVAFPLPHPVDQAWGGFVRTDGEPAYIVGDFRRMCTLPMSGLPVRTTRLRPKHVSIAASRGSDRAYVVQAGWKGAVHVVDAADGTSIGEPLYGHESAVCALRVLSSAPTRGLNILAVGNDGTVRLWNWQPPASGATTGPGDVVDVAEPAYVTAESRALIGRRAPSKEIWEVSRRGVRMVDGNLSEDADISRTIDLFPCDVVADHWYEDDEGMLGVFESLPDSAWSTAVAWHRVSPDHEVRTTRLDFARRKPNLARRHMIPPSDAHPHPRLVSVDVVAGVVDFVSPTRNPGTDWRLAATTDSLSRTIGSTALATSTGQPLLILAEGPENLPDAEPSFTTRLHLRDATSGANFGSGLLEMPLRVEHMVPFHTRHGVRYIACAGYDGSCGVVDLTGNRVHVVGTPPVTNPRRIRLPIDAFVGPHHLRWARLPSNDPLLVWMVAAFPHHDPVVPMAVHTWHSASPTRPGRLAVPAKRLLWAGNSPNGEAAVLVNDEHGIALCHLPSGELIWRTPLPALLNDAAVLADFDMAVATQQGVVLLRPRLSTAWRRRLGLARD